MIEYIVIFLFFVLAFGGFVAALQFSQYKKRPVSGCCGGGHCSTDGEETEKYHSCYSEKSEFVKNYKTSE